MNKVHFSFFSSLLFSVTATHAAMIERVNVSSSGQQGNNVINSTGLISTATDLNIDGRIVVFASTASNLVTGDSNNVQDIFIHDRINGETQRVSISSAGEQANQRSMDPYVSNDGKFIGFSSRATNLVNGVNDGLSHHYVHDRDTGRTIEVAASDRGIYGHPSFSADGRFEVFVSADSTLVPDDTNNRSDVFVRDSQTSSVERVNVSSAGKQANGHSGRAVMSVDGRYVVFSSSSTNLVLGGTANQDRIYIHDRYTEKTKLVGNLASDGQRAFNQGIHPSISDDARIIAFWSSGNQLPASGTNYIHIYDRETGLTEVLDIGLGGERLVGGFSTRPSISGDGKVVSFSSGASNLVTGDTNGAIDAFVAHSTLSTTTGDLSVKLWPRTHAVTIGKGFRSRAFLTNNSTSLLTNCRVDFFNPVIYTGNRLFDFHTQQAGIANPVINSNVDIPPGDTVRIDLVMKRKDFPYRDDMYFRYGCDSIRALPLAFVNTLFLNAKNQPQIAEDFIHLDTNGRRTVDIDRNNGKYWTPFVIRAVNRGDQATSVGLKAYSELARIKTLRQPQLCEPVDWASGNWTCSQPRAEEIQMDIAPGEIKKILVYLHSKEFIKEKPVSNRVFVEARDETGKEVSRTSIGVSTIN